MRRIHAVLFACASVMQGGLAGCAHFNPDAAGDAHGSPRETPLPTTAPSMVQDLVWGGSDYDVRGADKERFLAVVRMCWDSASRASPGSAGISRVDLTIDREGYVVDESVSVSLFHDMFLGERDVAAETAYLACAERGLHRLAVPPARAGTGTLFFDARLLPAR